MSSENEKVICEFCGGGHTKGCNSKSERDLFCTREPGHKGDHVACGCRTHVIARWKNENEQSKERTSYGLD